MSTADEPFSSTSSREKWLCRIFSSAYELVDFMATFQLKRRYMTRSDTAHIEQEQKTGWFLYAVYLWKRSTDLLVSNHRNNTSY